MLMPIYKLFLGDCEKSESIYFKNFKYRRASEVICTEMPAVLKVYVLLDCKLSFRCFDCVAAWSVNCGCNITPARGTKNFGIEILYSASVVDEPCSSTVKHWKDYFYRHKQNIPFRTAGFQCKLQIPFYRKILKEKYIFSQLQKNFL